MKFLIISAAVFLFGLILTIGTTTTTIRGQNPMISRPAQPAAGSPALDSMREAIRMDSINGEMQHQRMIEKGRELLQILNKAKTEHRREQRQIARRRTTAAQSPPAAISGRHGIDTARERIVYRDAECLTCEMVRPDTIRTERKRRHFTQWIKNLFSRK